MDELWVSEIFGPTLQGEGPSQGVPAAFLRLAGCNLACAWCDTPYTWDWKRYPKSDTHKLTPAETYEEILRHTPPGAELLVITGGEPMIQQGALSRVVPRLAQLFRNVEVETAGTIAPHPSFPVELVKFNVSPKLANSGNLYERRYKPEVLRTYRSLGATFKFVACTRDDFAEIERLCEETGIENVWIMPEGRTRQEVLAKLPWLFGECARRGWRLTPRLHVLAYDARRGM